MVRSTQELLPAFRDKIAELIELMHQDGFDALVFETWRSPERIAELVQKGTGAADSLHGYRAAADVIDAHLMWDAKPAFWQALHRHALALGLGRVRRKESDGVVRWDLPHVQALPGQFDGQVRALLADDARNDLLLEHYTA